MIFKHVGDGRPYPDHARTTREWADVPPRPVRLDQLITTKAVLDLRLLLSKESTFYGDLFPHVIQWQGELYLEDGLHRALGAALHQRSVLHARVLDLDAAAQPYEARASGSPLRDSDDRDSLLRAGPQEDSRPRAGVQISGPHRPKHSRRRSERGGSLAD